MKFLKRHPRFVLPAPDVFLAGSHGKYLQNFGSYSHYNYFQPGWISRIKRRHFEIALRLAEPVFGDAAAIDVGCADGVLLPSLSKYFKRVVGIDIRPEFVATARELVGQLNLSNVSLICNQGLSFGQLTELAGDVVFVLETLEHVGTPGGDVFAEKVQFLNGVFSLLKPDGQIIISVPRTVGAISVGQYLIQAMLKMPMEKMSISELVRAGFFGDTSRLEPRWKGLHLGFNDRKLSAVLRKNFLVKRECTSLTGRHFVLKRAMSSAAPGRASDPPVAAVP